MKKRHLFLLFLIGLYLFNSTSYNSSNETPKKPAVKSIIKSVMGPKPPLPVKPPTINETEPLVLENIITAAITEGLTLSLVDVIVIQNNEPVSQDSFEGTLITNDGFIESLTVTVGDKFSLDITNQQLNGNTFDYEIEFEPLSGMFYQTDQYSYIVYLSNGPHSGTRFVFKNQASSEDYAYNNL